MTWWSGHTWRKERKTLSGLNGLGIHGARKGRPCLDLMAWAYMAQGKEDLDVDRMITLKTIVRK
jgi:hypothetical protein